jgi:hypothetical protein
VTVRAKARHTDAVTTEECRIALEIGSAPFRAAMVARAIGVGAARADIPVDRLGEALIIGDALVAHTAGDARLELTVTGEREALAIVAGPYDRARVDRLLAETPFPGAPALLDELADGVEVRDRGRQLFVDVRLSG